MKPPGVILVLLVLFASLPRAFSASSPRVDIPLNAAWRFIREDVSGAEAPSFGDAAWQAVTLPHCWNIQPGQAGDEAAYYRGAGWYRRHLTLPAGAAGKSAFLRFEAAYVVTDVYVNGQSAGRHVGGFGAFCFDVTSLLHPGDNVLAVRVQGTTDGTDTPPAGGDYTKFGGLYRPVHLLLLDRLSVTPLDDASPGVYLTPLRVDSARAEVRVTTKLRNANPAPRTATVRCRIVDRNGRTVKMETGDLAVPANGTADAVQSLTVSHPHLWNGRPDPYVYRAIVDVLDGHRLADRVEQPLGLRSFSVDPAKGFLLNGKPYKLHGVNRHQDRIDKGWAITPADMKQDLRFIMDMGATCVRTAHYQHADEWQSLCDRAGIVLWSELCMVNAVHPTAEYHENARHQLAELIKQNYNHPSVFFWSLWNEISFAKRQPSADDIAFLKSLNAEAHQLDPTRLTTGANNNMTTQRETAPITDIIGWNGYPGWYGGKPDGWDKTIPDLHAAFAGKAIGVSEYGAGASIHQHELDLQMPKNRGHFHPEEWQSHIHESHWRSFRAHPELWGTFVWNMFDFSSITRNEGDHRGRNDKGLVTYDRKVPKDAYYFYQAQWTEKPMVHITSRRFTPHPAGPTEVKVYSNTDAVELFLNGESLGAKRSVDRVFRWPDVDLPAGRVELKAVGRKGKATVRDIVIWTCAPDAPAHMGPDDSGVRG